MKDNLAEISVPRYLTKVIEGIHTHLLNRVVNVELILPADYAQGNKKYPLLVLNDGQESKAVKVLESLDKLSNEGSIPDIIVAGVIAGDRMQEYGVAAKPDYLKRGSKAKAYSKFIIQELIPYLIYEYPIDPAPEKHAIAGYSLGGLSALDIAWNNPQVFKIAGIFSGSLWWRKRDAKSHFYSDEHDRIMHHQVRGGKLKPGMKFWFQTGTLDEHNDRNKNGVIDSIDDTLDMIVELTRKGYRPFWDINYLEVKEGKHHPDTWAAAMPAFLIWTFGKK